MHRPRYDDWAWPKGKVDPGEAVAAAAVREVEEETGHAVVLGAPLPTLRYRTSDGLPKRVHYWAARVARRGDGPALAARAAVTPATRDEIDRVRWVGVDDARTLLTRRTDRAPLDALLALHAKGRLTTDVLVVARHGRARRRSAWAGDETDRPLTSTGRAQAVALVPVLAAFGVLDVVTSRWERCAATIQPYADAAGLVPGSAYLTEAEHERSPSRVAGGVHRLLERRRDVVVCTHRPVLPTVLDVLGQHSPRPVADALPAKDPYLRTGEVLVAHVAQTAKGPRVVAVEQHRPPVA
ncbi:NUDIX domain-containing protein [Cellulomonas sp. ATA003]|uniref:NUDIX domain-containing protein n=1 Tax=Cellulomonas sp. ATA003 TaxID=3073064 RepID=UPI002873B407|nr:NUDIX domain-containing protein [Cellulomonas sp. ATA003]WNB85360.1 NUDIX domain-containing protein [Cellulomonas sp. ATA003]